MDVKEHERLHLDTNSRKGTAHLLFFCYNNAFIRISCFYVIFQNMSKIWWRFILLMEKIIIL